MTIEESAQLKRIVAEATRTAKQHRTDIAVFDFLYPETSSERFQYAPIAGLNILHRSDHYALIGIAWAAGIYQTAGDFLEKHYRR